MASWEREMQEACCVFPACELQAYEQGLRDARKACIAVSDPQDNDGDKAYDQAVRDCVRAVEALIKVQV